MPRNNSEVRPGRATARLDDPDLISVTYATAVELTGISLRALQRAVQAGDLVPRYPTARPVLLVDELRAWIRNAPCESPAEASAA